MTISSTYTPAQFSGNSVTVAFAFTFKTFDEADLVVVLTSSSGVETTKTITTHYTVSLNADQNNNPGGTVTMITAPATGETLTIARELDALQETDITNGGGFYPEVIEDALDRLTMLSQQNSDILARSLRSSVAGGSVGDLPTATDRASKYLAFDASGDPIANNGTAGSPTSAFMETVLDDTTASEARATLGVAIGTTVQAYDAQLDTWAGVTPGTGIATALAVNLGSAGAVASLVTAETFTAAQRGAYSLLTDGATITPDFALANQYRVQLGGNRTLANPSNIVAGQSGAIDIYQDSTGSRTLAYQWGWQFAGGTAPTLTTTARAKDKLAYAVDVYAQSTITVTIATPGVVSWTAHGLMAGQQVQLSTTGALPTGLVAATTYFVIPVDANSFQLAATQNGAAINTTGSQSGVHTMTAISITGSLIAAVK